MPAGSPDSGVLGLPQGFSSGDGHELGPAQRTAAQGGPGQAAGMLPPGAAIDDRYLNKLSPEAQARMQAKNLLFDEIVDQIKTAPADTAELLRSWVADDIADEHAATPTV